VNSNRNFGSRSKRYHRAKRRGAILLLLCGIIVASAIASFFIPRRANRAAAPAALASLTPLATPKPVPWTFSQIARLRADLRTAFAPAIAGARHWSLCVMDSSGRILYAEHARVAVKPASVEKLIVATTALDLLGASYRYDTVLAASAAAAGGTLPGNLWLVGAGDPSLRSSDLDAAVKALWRSGIRRIGGNVVVDASAFRGPEFNPHWNPDDDNEDYQAPIGALSLDDGTVEFDIRGTTPGAPAVARMNPWSEAVHAQGQIATIGASDDPNVIVAALEAPNSFALSGSIPAGDLDREWVPVHDMARYAAAVLTQILRQNDIAVGSAPGVGVAPQRRVVLWQHRSESLRALEHHMLYLSDNHYAEQLMRTLGFLETGAGDDARGLAVERRDLRARAIPTPGLRLVDGSGLSEANRVAALTLATILVRALQLPQERGFFDLLPQGGRDGTVGDYPFTSALGRVRAKTGHLTGVSSLAGYVAARHHGVVVFAFTIDGSPGDPDGAMVHAIDRISEF
jgi:D-alanyl-D-alanine carboxypeptidase/D-alanyl-D-alanine-endopeptidase (penicillin-binding protein 4)